MVADTRSQPHRRGRMLAVYRWLVALVVGAALAGCTSPPESPPSPPGPTPTSQASAVLPTAPRAPVTVRQHPDVPTATATSAVIPSGPVGPRERTPDPSAGQRKFNAVGCAVCHGDDARGGAMPFAPVVAGTTRDFSYLLKLVRTPWDPGGRMPPYSPQQLSDDDLRDIHAWLRSLPASSSTPSGNMTEPASPPTRATVPFSAPPILGDG